MKIRLDPRIYPLEAVLNASYLFIEEAYIFLDIKRQSGDIEVSIQGKKNLSAKKLELLASRFMNELLHCTLRHIVSKNNRKIKEYIVGRALYSVLPSPGSASFSKEGDFKNDPLGIAKSWEDQYGIGKDKRARVKV